MPAIILLLVLGIGLFVGPIVAIAMNNPLGGFVTGITMGAGLLLLVVSVGLLLYMKLFVKTSASSAFIRTGRGAKKVVIDGGAFVIGFMHKMVWVTLETLKVEVQKTGHQALFTADNLLADINAQFFVSVNKDPKSVEAAAKAFGEKGLTSSLQVTTLIGEKLEDALRTAAVKLTLQELISDRDKFVENVSRILMSELEPNGLKLESASISLLDQADFDLLKDNNIIHSQGKKTIAKIVQENLTETNKQVREGERAREEEDVSTRKKILAYQQDQADAEARQQAEIKKIQADQHRDAEERRIEAERQVELAAVQKQQAVLVAAERQKQDVEVADRERQKAVEVAEQDKLEASTRAAQKVEVAEREKLQAIAAAERTVAESETAKAQAEAEREKARQSVQTVTVVETAERLKRQEVIQAEAEAEKNYVTAQRSADAKAYGVTKDAEARKEAADADAEAIKKKAEADRDAEVARAEGLKANEMVPVQVEAERVSVAQRNVEQVIKPELEAREKHGKVAQDFELAKAQISAEMQVRIETAKAAATMYQRVEVKAFATLDDVSKMTGKMMSGMGAAELANGFSDSLENDTLSRVAGGLQAVKGMVGALAKKAGVTAEELASTAPVVVDKSEAKEAALSEKGGNSTNSAE